ncbi:MAG: hypothetical protein L0211_23805 [Planctomycetaceae bacterium]|nr:hypothetical protein [Planctomycetaceae bacterium]
MTGDLPRTKNEGRLAAVVALCFGMALVIAGFGIAILSAAHNLMIGFWAGLSTFFIGLAFALPIVLNASAMHFEYSRLGPTRPELFPQNWSPAVFAGMSAGIGYWGLRASIPLATWYVGVEGIGLQIIGVCTIFIRRQDIASFERYSRGSEYLHHGSVEVESPILIPTLVADHYRAAVAGVAVQRECDGGK